MQVRSPRACVRLETGARGAACARLHNHVCGKDEDQQTVDHIPSRILHIILEDHLERDEVCRVENRACKKLVPHDHAEGCMVENEPALTHSAEGAAR